MNSHRSVSLILGATSRLGIAVAHRLVHREGSPKCIIAADTSNRVHILRGMQAVLRRKDIDFELLEIDADKPTMGLKRSDFENLSKRIDVLFHLAHLRDRTRPGTQIRTHNRILCNRAIELARLADHLRAMLVVTDVGIVGDYPGRFSESWIDVGQVPFDEVDRSSLEVELMCAEAGDLPIIRTRVGLLSDFTVPGLGGEPWTAAARVLLPSLGLWRVLPRFMSIPTAVAKGALAPLTPTDWAADALLHLSELETFPEHAVHLIVTPQPPLEKVIERITERAGGARLKGHLPVAMLKKLGELPGLGDAARRQVDHIASWWTPHRYCLSKNDLDVSGTRVLFKDILSFPLWGDVEGHFFLHLE